jgi:hypothetical protein
MTLLSELSDEQRKEIARALAQSAFGVIDKPDGPGGNDPPSKRLFAMLADAGPVHEKEFYGKGFDAERSALLDQEFDKIHSEALAHAKLYDECVKPVQEAAPTFALASSALVRMWCISHYTRLLCKEGGPFWTLEMADEIEDEGLTEESDSSDQDSYEDDEDCSDEDDEDVIVVTSDESESDDEERERKKRKRERKKMRQEKLKGSDDESEERE